jgi:DNA-binding CsgD family transcriptional regulator
VMLDGADDDSRRLASSAPVAGTPAEQAACGLLWFALGTAALRNPDRGRDRDAATALGHAERRLSVGMPELVGRTRGWRALAEARSGNLAAADRLIGELRTEQRDPAVACLTALAAARVALHRGDRAAATALCARADTAAAGWPPGEPDAAPAAWLPGEPDVAALSMRLRFQARVPDEPDAAGPSLTDSELAVLRLLPGYLTNQEIAEELFLSVNTVKTHLKSAYRKLGVTSRRAAIAQGRRLGVL